VTEIGDCPYLKLHAVAPGGPPEGQCKDEGLLHKILLSRAAEFGLGGHEVNTKLREGIGCGETGEDVTSRSWGKDGALLMKMIFDSESE
jgi:hypothetical protein